MESKHARSQRDKRTADETIKQANEDRALMCGADGCPNRWTVDMEGRACSAHAWAPRHLWPQITEEQLTAQAMRAVHVPPPVTLPKYDRERLKATLEKLSAEKPKYGRDVGWAHRILERHAAGERISKAALEMAHGALHEDIPTEPLPMPAKPGADATA